MCCNVSSPESPSQIYLALSLVSAGLHEPHSGEGENCAMRRAHDAALRHLDARSIALVILPGRMEAVWARRLHDCRCDPAPILSARTALLTLYDRSVEGSGVSSVPRRYLTCTVSRLHKSRDIARAVDACHFAPVRHGMTRTPEAWKLSTVHMHPASDMIIG